MMNAINMNDIVSNSFWVVPLVLAVVQAIKMMGIPTKFAPIISIGVGMGVGMLVNSGLTLTQNLLSGVIYGLSASGLFSGITVTQQVHDVKSGEIPIDQVDKGLLSQRDIQEIQQKQNQQNPSQQNQSQQNQSQQKQTEQKIMEQKQSEQTTIIKP